MNRQFLMLVYFILSKGIDVVDKKIVSNLIELNGNMLK